jgi:hypothetical protein
VNGLMRRRRWKLELRGEAMGAEELLYVLSVLWVDFEDSRGVDEGDGKYPLEVESGGSISFLTGSGGPASVGGGIQGVRGTTVCPVLLTVPSLVVQSPLEGSDCESSVAAL